MSFRSDLVRCLSAIGVMCVAQAAFAQQTPPQPSAPPARPAFQMPPPTPNDTLKSVEVDPDHHVHFRIWAPNATDVKLQAEGPEATPDITPEEAYKNMGGVPLVKGGDGVWEVVIGPIQPGAYRYTFVVDGVSTTTEDPLTSQALTHSASLYEVPGSDFIEYKAGVPHGALRVSTTTHRLPGGSAGCTFIRRPVTRPGRHASPCSTFSMAEVTRTTRGAP